MEDLRYPIGKFEWVPPQNEAEMAKRRTHYIDVLEQLPGVFTQAVEGLSAAQLDTPYRPEGWTVRQLAGHVPDSHANASPNTSPLSRPTKKTCGPSWPIPPTRPFKSRCSY
jgi:hypothetical protein